MLKDRSLVWWCVWWWLWYDYIRRNEKPKKRGMVFMYEIVKFTDDQGRSVQITPEDVKRHLCPQANDSEIMMFLALCKSQRLNPFIKDAYLVKYGSGPASIITSKEVFTKRANANPNYEGFEAGVVFVDRNGKVQHREGSAVYKGAGEVLVGGWCRVFVKGLKPFYDEVTLDEYSTGKSMWSKAPATMIRKVALVHCLREAFAEDMQGLYSAEEMGNAGAAVLEDKPAPIEAPYVEMIGEAQAETLELQVAELAEVRGTTAETVQGWLYASKVMQALNWKPSDEMTAQQADAALQLLAHWIEAAREQAKETTAEYETVEEAPSAMNQALERARAAYADAEE
jgi:phage recombination protein Bet